MSDDKSKTNLTDEQLGEASGGAQHGRTVGYKCKACGAEVGSYNLENLSPCPKCGAIDYKPIKRYDAW